MKLSFSVLATIAALGVASATPFRILTDAPAHGNAQPPIEINSFHATVPGGSPRPPCHGQRHGSLSSFLMKLGIISPPHEAPRDSTFIGKEAQDDWWRKMKHVKENAGIGALPHPPSRLESGRLGWVAIAMSQPDHPQVPGNGRHAGKHAHPHGVGHGHDHGHYHHGKSFMERLSRAANQLSTIEQLVIAFVLGAGISITLAGVLMAAFAVFRGAGACRRRAIQLPAYEAVPTQAVVVVDEKRPVEQ